ncbi:MAG: NAD(P)-binding protein [Spirochaetales bacterium]|nr:NAD(P)-binding protein [Spirochaetales bacterium]
MRNPKIEDFIVVGAGLSGLACARTAAQTGLKPLLIDRSLAVGGRCASKPVSPELPPWDFGPIFWHGDANELEALTKLVGEEELLPWPLKVKGVGLPCQPEAFEEGQFRRALVSGLRRWPEVLAQDLSVKTGVLARKISWNSEGVSLVTDQGILQARDLVLALAPEQTQEVFENSLAEEPQLASSLALLRQFSTLPSLTVLAWYANGPELAWDVWYPETSREVLLISHEASKRRYLSGNALVIQARPAWSEARLEVDRSLWAKDLLESAAKLVGQWVQSPDKWLAHRWKYARRAPGDGLKPLVLTKPGSPGRIAVTGELFDSGGLSSAFRAGERTAQKLLNVKERPQH